jgi:cell division protein FtsI (penicillin-binding protein 3)
MDINKGERNRGFLLFLFFCFWVLFVAASLVKIQVLDYGENVARVQSQSNRMFTLHSKRGAIYDSSGEILAISIKTKSAFLSNKNKAESRQLFKRVLRNKIRLTAQERKNILRRIEGEDKFIWIKRKLTEGEYRKLAKIKSTSRGSSSLDFIEEYKRIYPQQATASHILGGVGIDEQGLAGIEYSLESLIRGKDCKVKVEQDARRKVFSLQYLEEPGDGRDVHLTIDSPVQFFVEKELEDTVKKYHAKSGTVIVMDSRDGAILAMANYPDYNPADIKRVPSALLKNKAISFLYHPGSTFKIVLASTALERNICSPQQKFNCYNGVYEVRNLKIFDDHGHDRLSFEDIIIYSSNIGAARIGEKLGRNRLYKGIDKFSFGSRTDIRLPGEERGIFNPLSGWTGVSVAFLSHGYEIAVTPLQMLRAFNALANNGYLIQPYIVKKIDGVILKRPEPQKILSPGTVHRMVAIMTQVVEKGTGKSARIEGMSIAAKTGTTKRISRKKITGAGNDKYVSSFGGFFPANNPRVTMFVVVNEPRGQYYGGHVAAPLFKSIAEKLMIYLEIFPELDNKNEIRL